MATNHDKSVFKALWKGYQSGYFDVKKQLKLIMNECKMKINLLSNFLSLLFSSSGKNREMLPGSKADGKFISMLKIYILQHLLNVKFTHKTHSPDNSFGWPFGWNQIFRGNVPPRTFPQALIFLIIGVLWDSPNFGVKRSGWNFFYSPKVWTTTLNKRMFSKTLAARGATMDKLTDVYIAEAWYISVVR